MNIFIKSSAIIISLTILNACSGDQKANNVNESSGENIESNSQELPQEAKVSEAIEPVSTDTITTGSGLQYILLQEGSGPTPQQGQKVEVHYAGFLTDGTKFDSSFDRNEPIEFNIGTGAVIAGWDEGIALLSTGAKARLIIPAYLGYGSGGYGSIIPPDATLIFDVELVGLK